MPLNEKGKKILSSMQKEYGAKKGKEVFYASENKGTVRGVKKMAEGGMMVAVQQPSKNPTQTAFETPEPRFETPEPRFGSPESSSKRPRSTPDQVAELRKMASANRPIASGDGNKKIFNPKTAAQHEQDKADTLKRQKDKLASMGLNYEQEVEKKDKRLMAERGITSEQLAEVKKKEENKRLQAAKGMPSNAKIGSSPASRPITSSPGSKTTGQARTTDQKQSKRAAARAAFMALARGKNTKGGKPSNTQIGMPVKMAEGGMMNKRPIAAVAAKAMKNNPKMAEPIAGAKRPMPMAKGGMAAKKPAMAKGGMVKKGYK